MINFAWARSLQKSVPVMIATTDSSGFQEAAKIPDSKVPSTSDLERIRIDKD